MLRLCSDSSRFPDQVRDRLIRGDLLHMPSVRKARLLVTVAVMEQESAEAIVCAGQRTDQEG